MGSAPESAAGLTLSHDTFGKLTPGPFLLAHLKQESPVRPNGRAPHAFRTPSINTGSLSYSNGSAVVRMGDTAVVCSIRSEILLASDIPHPPRDELDAGNLIEELGLLVLNVEMSTGCSPANLPGNPPSTLAQSLSYRLNSLMHDSRIIDEADLRIQYESPSSIGTAAPDGPLTTTKAYWTLYIDVLCLALDGNALDAACLAIVAALRDTKLPRAWWDQDEEMVVCSPLLREASHLSMREIPLMVSFAVFTTASPLKDKDDCERWILADPDAFEEEVCEEMLTIALTQSKNGSMVMLTTEKTGGSQLDLADMRNCVAEAEHRWASLSSILV